jgi:hypothetical protein
MTDSIAELIETAFPACPPWCSLPAGHPYDLDIAGVEISRAHMAFDDDSDVNVVAVETVSVAGAVTVSDPEIMLCARGNVDADQARRVAAQLSAAADKLQEIAHVQLA